MLLQEYIDEARALDQQLTQITFFMRGGIDLEQAHMMSPRQRKDALKLIEENMERTSKTGVMMH